MGKNSSKAVDYEYKTANGSVQKDTAYGTKSEVEQQLLNLSQGGEIEILPPKKK